MFPQKNQDVKFTSAFLNQAAGFIKFKDKQLVIMKMDLIQIRSNGSSQYNAYFSDGSSINSVVIDGDGKDTVYGVDVFEDWAYTNVSAPVNFSVPTPIKIVKIVSRTIGGEPKNNDGRDTCFWCGKPTNEYIGLFSRGNVCNSCGK